MNKAPKPSSARIRTTDLHIRHYPENSPNDTAIVIPAKERHPVPRYGAGIQFPAPAASLAAIERPSSFSCFVVPVATDMRDSSENSPVQSPVGAIPESPLLPFSSLVVSVATDMGDWNENSQRPTSVEAGFKSAPVYVGRTPAHWQRHKMAQNGTNFEEFRVVPLTDLAMPPSPPNAILNSPSPDSVSA